ncbi:MULTISPECIES: MCE family protein [Mycolicibacterium]|uniref:MCE family protein n=1 Tax=Mycolicibacterium monacense TaxID=85693 RepID=UPI0007E930D1|nr:MCE family protein [Mycolicibacterium monacense]OBB77620.1 MCE-family protein MCE1A [Mycolicibacterium monacense]
MASHRRHPPYRLAGAVALGVVCVVAATISLQFRGAFAERVTLTLLSPRAGLVVDPGAKVTFNGVEIGRVTAISARADETAPAELALSVDPRHLHVIPANVIADIRASTVFGNKYVALRSPDHPAREPISPDLPIRSVAVTTEFNTLFETVVSLAERVDPVKLNQTLAATAEALTGLGARFGESLEHGAAILADLNPRMDQVRHDVARTADLAGIYADASPDLWSALDHAALTAATVNARRSDVDAALLAAAGFEAGADTLRRAGPYLLRGSTDLQPTTALLDDYRGMIFCTIRNYHDVAPEIQRTLGGDNGYALRAAGTVLGAGNPYVYPDNLPRINARGGPGGRPGCWQKVTRELWPHPYLVMDTGYSLAPYNHAELGQPFAMDYVWGRQLGELTINP